MTITEHDSLMTQHGLPTLVDTVDVCESWTGSDYDYQAIGVGSSDNIPGFIDDVQTIVYEGGQVTGYAMTGEASAEPSGVGSTAFDFLLADDATRQASYDDPYYGVSSPDPNACTTCLQVVQSSRDDDAGAGSAILGDTLPKFSKHGLSRRGVRALVENAVEIGRSSDGYRQFRTVIGETTIVRGVHPGTQLLMTEELTEPEEAMRVTHTWSRVPGGYVRAHSEFSTSERINGKNYVSSARIVFQNVQVTDKSLWPTNAQGVAP